MKKCPGCSSDQVLSSFKRKDLLEVYSCSNCGLRFVSRDDFNGLYGTPDELYEKDYFETGGDRGFRDYHDSPVENFYWQKAFVGIIDDPRGKRILDVGCGTGRFLGLLSKACAEVEGVELSRYAGKIASDHGVRIAARQIGQLPDTPRYDIVTAFDVIEHVTELHEFLAKIRRLLKPAGAFIFMTPDAGSPRALAEQERWYGYNSSLEHLYYFSEESLRYHITHSMGGTPYFYHATAADGDGLLGFLRLQEREGDTRLGGLFKHNFSADLLTEADAVSAAVLLQRIGDERWREIVGRFRSAFEERRSEEEVAFVLTKVEPPQAVRPQGGDAAGERKVTVRPSEEGDDKGLMRLFSDVFGREMIPREWQWKYRGKPLQDVHTVAVAQPGGEIVGHNGGLPERIMYAGRETIAVQSCDTMIRREFRGFWLMKKLMTRYGQDVVEKGFVSCHGFPTERTFLLPAERLRIIERCTDVYDAAKETTFSSGFLRFSYRLAPLTFDDARINGLWKNFLSAHRIVIVRDSDYLKWRYVEHPLFTYRFWGLTKRWGRELLGLAVTKDDGPQRMSAVDLVFRPGMLRPLLRKIENLAYSSGKHELVLWLPERYHCDLRDSGFALTRSCALARLVRPELIGKEELASDFYFTMGDADYL